MKTTINNTRGVVITQDGDGLDINVPTNVQVLTVTSGTLGTFDATSGSFDDLRVNSLPHENFAFENRWDDIFGTFDQGSAASALTTENFRNTSMLMMFMRSDQNDSLTMHYQMSHQWNSTTAIRPHIHVIPCGAPVGTEIALFGYQACWVPLGSVIPAGNGWITGSVELQVSASMQYVNTKFSLGTFSPPANASHSTEFIIKVMRSGSSAADTYTTAKDHGTGAANLGVIHMDVHYQKIAAGSVNA